MPKKSSLTVTRAGAARRVRIEEWTYDYNTGNCIKFRTVEKTTSNPKFTKKFGKTIQKASFRFRHSIDDIGRKLTKKKKKRMTLEKENAVLAELMSYETSGDESSVNDSTVESVLIASTDQDESRVLSPEFAEQDTNVETDKGSTHDDMEEEQQVQIDVPDQQQQSRCCSLGSEVKLSDTEDQDIPYCTNIPNDPKEMIPAELNAWASQKPEISIDDDSGLSGISISIKLENSLITESGTEFIESKFVSVSPTRHRHVSCIEADFDLTKSTCSWETFEDMMNRADILSYHCNNMPPDHKSLPDTITVLGTKQNVSRLQIMLEQVTDKVETVATTISNTEFSDTDTNDPMTEDVSDSTILNEIKRLDDFIFGKTSENVRFTLSPKETAKVISALSVLTSKISQYLDPLDIDPGYQSHQLNKTEISRSVSSVTDQSDSDAESILEDDEVMETVAQEVLNDMTMEKKRIDVELRAGSSEADIEDNFDSVGDGLVNTILSEDALKMTLEHAMKQAAVSSALKKSSLLCSQLLKSDNFTSSVQSQEVYNCTCFESKSATAENSTITEVTPVSCNEPQMTINLPLQYVLSHFGPTPSKFELKFEDDIRCNVLRVQDTWHIQFGETSNQDNINLKYPDLQQDSASVKELFSSLGRHFEFSFSDDTDVLRVSAIVRDHQMKMKGTLKKSSRKSATTIGFN